MQEIYVNQFSGNDGSYEHAAHYRPARTATPIQAPTSSTSNLLRAARNRDRRSSARNNKTLPESPVPDSTRHQSRKEIQHQGFRQLPCRSRKELASRSSASIIVSNEYRYTRLATVSTIRLIKLEEQKVDDTISCVIRHAEYWNAGYHALSYVWGDPTPTRYIYLGYSADEKFRFSVHENLWRFLNWAWEHDLYGRWFWTDQICLNQLDKNEIGQQIPRMGEIFGSARQVMAWLGMSRADGEELVRSARKSQASFPGRTISDIQTNRYWSRVWIVQEVVKARDVAVIVGDVEMGLRTLRNRCLSNIDEDTIGDIYRLRYSLSNKFWEGGRRVQL